MFPHMTCKVNARLNLSLGLDNTPWRWLKKQKTARNTLSCGSIQYVMTYTETTRSLNDDMITVVYIDNTTQ